MATASQLTVPLDPDLAGEIAGLEALRRLALGATHAWNNALTAILGEVRCLADERSEDAALARVCGEIEREAQRCARLSRALQSRAAWRPGDPAEVDLSALARALAPVLRDTVSRSVALAWDVPADAPWVQGRREDVELLLILAAQELLRGAPGGAELRIAVGKLQDRHVEVSLHLLAPDAAPELAPAERPWDAFVAAAAEALAARCGASWGVEAGARRARLRFAAT
jgi:C4-dicarboxylate-specific signal transduction histidine kinase